MPLKGYILGYFMALYVVNMIFYYVQVKQPFQPKSSCSDEHFLLPFFQEKLASGPFLQDKVKECFKDNPHCFTLVMNPDVSLLFSMFH